MKQNCTQFITMPIIFPKQFSVLTALVAAGFLPFDYFLPLKLLIANIQAKKDYSQFLG